MNETRKSDATISDNIPNSLPQEVTDSQPKSEKNSTSKQSASSVSELLEGQFSLDDLKCLIFVFGGFPVNVWEATAEQFQTYVQQYAEIENVNTDLWPHGERLYLLNRMFAFCEETGNGFPFFYDKILTVKEANS